MNIKKGILLISLGATAIFFSMYWMIFNVGVSWENLRIQYAYFTNQVTVITGVYFILAGIAYCGAKSLKRVVFHPGIKAAVTAFAAIVGIGYYVGVIPFSVFTAEELYIGDIQSIYMHAVHPAILMFFYFKTPFAKFKKKPSLISLTTAAMIYPVCYLFSAEIKAAFHKFYVYPFLDPAIMGGAEMVLIVSLAVSAAGGLVVLAFVENSRKRDGQQTAPVGAG